MDVRGRVENGVVVPFPGTSFPEGAEVTVVVRPGSEPRDGCMWEQERRRILEIMDRIAGLPIEGDPEPFSGADHDKVLYGKP